ncbi:MAG TPA: IS630 family transposase [Flavisolibacter sp.]|nr:IS630 family transposase [Flavisolibacter sp.]
MKVSWCISKVDASFLAAMEDVLDVYAQPYDPAYPVICFDERPCFLIADTITPIPTQSGKIAKEHYSYEKNGSCCLLAAIEPLQGKRIAQVYDQRTKKEYTAMMKVLADGYAGAKKIRVVQDNLNTHSISSFYEHLAADEAKALAERFEFHYTPKSASWLNMIEIEFSALSKQCLNRRIGTKQMLEEQINTIVKERNEKQIKINWQFSIQKARTNLNNRYTAVNSDNLKFKQT